MNTRVEPNNQDAEKSVLASHRSIITVFLFHRPLMIRATLSVPPVGLKMISIVFICITSRYSILFWMTSVHSANVLPASVRENASSMSVNISVKTGRMCRPTMH